MRTVEQILSDHKKWRDGDGKYRIVWEQMPIDERSLLSDAILRRADLGDAMARYVACGWTDHGEGGRMLLAVDHGVDGWICHCGCFRGSLEKLRDYIENGQKRYRASRTAAMDFISARIAEMDESKEAANASRI